MASTAEVDVVVLDGRTLQPRSLTINSCSSSEKELLKSSMSSMLLAMAPVPALAKPLGPATLLAKPHLQWQDPQPETQ